MLENQNLIMIVDDTPANLKLLQQMLSNSGYKVAAFPHGKLALAAASRNVPDLILLDINMPDMNGFEVCKKLKEIEELKDVPVIFISALNETGDKVSAFSAGGVDYVTKPFQFEEVLARVKTHLSLCNAQRELKKQNDILQENLRLREVIDQISKHDLKGPMTAILNVPEMLMGDANLKPDQLELLQILSQSAYRLLELIQRSLDLYKIENGTYEVSSEPINLVKIFREIFTTFSLTAQAKNIKYVLLSDLNVPDKDFEFIVHGEEYLYFLMFSNLIKNAVEASPENQQITVSLCKEPDFFVSINNRGAIPQQIRDRFFEKYVTHGKQKGTGLGTYSAWLIAKTIGGNLTFTTDEESGTTLKFALGTK